MQYNEAHYRLILLFGKAEPKTVPLKNLEFQLLKFIPENSLVKSMFENGLTIKSSRTSKFKKHESVKKFIESSDGNYTASSLYIFDRHYSKETAPYVFCNIYFALNGKFSLRNLKYKGIQASSFFVFAVRNDHREIDNFCDESQIIFEQFRGLKGFLLKDVGYNYDGKSPIEWAYKNIPSRIVSGNLSDWSEKGEEISGVRKIGGDE